uniref:Uncharacterized protein n=1 Tax=Anguilla anguilla TaxID=7936 RepID=A0A0E9UPZ1_ANGAN
MNAERHHAVQFKLSNKEMITVTSETLDQSKWPTEVFFLFTAILNTVKKVTQTYSRNL